MITVGIGALQVSLGNMDNKIQQGVCAEVMNYRIIEYLKLEGPHKDHQSKPNSLIPSLCTGQWTSLLDYK